MLLPRVWAPVRASNSISNAACKSSPPSSRALDALRTAALAPLSLIFVRHATHASEGRANQAKNGPGKRLGAKKTAEEYVVPGNIIYKQRGTVWHPGENVNMGRDHTLHASISGYVKYYRNPRLHPDRKYIGVAYERDDQLPYPLNAARKRRLGMVAVPISTSGFGKGADFAVDGLPDGEAPVVRDIPRNQRGTRTTRHGYAPRPANWEIGRAAERAGIKVSPFVKGDRWTAWRKANARGQKITQIKALKRRKGGKAKK